MSACFGMTASLQAPIPHGLQMDTRMSAPQSSWPLGVFQTGKWIGLDMWPLRKPSEFLIFNIFHLHMSWWAHAEAILNLQVSFCHAISGFTTFFAVNWGFEDRHMVKADKVWCEMSHGSATGERGKMLATCWSSCKKCLLANLEKQTSELQMNLAATPGYRASQNHTSEDLTRLGIESEDDNELDLNSIAIPSSVMFNASSLSIFTDHSQFARGQTITATPRLSLAQCKPTTSVPHTGRSRNPPPNSITPSSSIPPINNHLFGLGMEEPQHSSNSLQASQLSELTSSHSSDIEVQFNGAYTPRRRHPVTAVPAPLRDSVDACSRPKASDYMPRIKKLLLSAAYEFEALIMTRDAYPDSEVQRQWAYESWHNVTDPINDSEESDSGGAEHSGFELTDHMITVGDSPDVHRKNIHLHRRLLEKSSFHYKDPGIESGMRSGFGQHTIISRVLEVCFFKKKSKKTSFGLTYPQHFNLFPLPTMVLILAAVEHDIEEWSTGVHVMADFRELEGKPLYEAYLADLRTWENPPDGPSNKTVVCNIRKKLYKRGREFASLSAEDSEKPSRASKADMQEAYQELAGRTGETDSEAE
ncbi:predicted protein [Postia placenta Mad-698-R]|uniref:DUF6532 domain-containing protein n=1 Tax=Postia placenta MAD-698-R-SB12 TaxID=670580 RepID=A0A1X6NDY3_9APHY|nr:hypothetical protein POSPLADRAFT_1130905 [Postia placenta MAD-698-R-SB12]EED84354.1 predicted protein [Postia placenta Mad-698-R]OSX66646.1 hypothetical protein POSPLADRAFT_1130905 [Postia placenta MAD-698-R-SB12]